MIHIRFEKVIGTLAASIEKTVDSMVESGHISEITRDVLFYRFEAHLNNALAGLQCELNK